MPVAAVVLLSNGFVGDVYREEAYKKHIARIKVPIVPKRLEELANAAKVRELTPSESTEIAVLYDATAKDVDRFVAEVEKEKPPKSLAWIQKDLVDD